MPRVEGHNTTITQLLPSYLPTTTIYNSKNDCQGTILIPWMVNPSLVNDENHRKTNSPNDYQCISSIYLFLCIKHTLEVINYHHSDTNTQSYPPHKQFRKPKPDPLLSTRKNRNVCVKTCFFTLGWIIFTCLAFQLDFIFDEEHFSFSLIPISNQCKMCKE